MRYTIDKPIRLIELFAGIGSQAMALRAIGANFEHYKVVEFDKFAIASYNAIHGTNFPTIDITQIHGYDLGIVETDKFTYLLTYSFPCQDLSVAGKMKGMSKGDGTRSGLLWEVERLLNETKELPQILLMENVPQVHGKKNKADFDKWLDYLSSRGYSTYWQDLNAKDYGVAQSRNRCFAISVLGDYEYTFPMPVELTKTVKDYLEPSVDERYYLKTDKAKKLIDTLISNGKITIERERERERESIVSDEPRRNKRTDICTGDKHSADTMLPRLQGRVTSSVHGDMRERKDYVVDCTINAPSDKTVANCIKARYDSGISDHRSDGTAVIECQKLSR